MIDLYAILGVGPTATDDEIHKAYRRMIKCYHPDVYNGSDAELRITLIRQAYDTLKDPVSRKVYDDALARYWQEQQQTVPPQRDYTQTQTEQPYSRAERSDTNKPEETTQKKSTSLMRVAIILIVVYGLPAVLVYFFGSLGALLSPVVLVLILLIAGKIEFEEFEIKDWFTQHVAMKFMEFFNSLRIKFLKWPFQLVSETVECFLPLAFFIAISFIAYLLANVMEQGDPKKVGLAFKSILFGIPLTVFILFKMIKFSLKLLRSLPNLCRGIIRAVRTINISSIFRICVLVLILSFPLWKAYFNHSITHYDDNNIIDEDIIEDNLYLINGLNVEEIIELMTKAKQGTLTEDEFIDLSGVADELKERAQEEAEALSESELVELHHVATRDGYTPSEKLKGKIENWLAWRNVQRFLKLYKTQ